MKILLTGGAGYIGAVTAKELEKQGCEVLVYDHFVSHSPTKLGNTPYVRGGILDVKTLEKTLSQFQLALW